MGLKYTVFMWKGSADDLMQRFKQSATMGELQIVDTTDMMRREREWILTPVDLSKPMTDFEPKDEELIKYINHKRLFEVYWMDHPTRKNIVVGGFSHYWWEYGKYLTVFSTLFNHIGITEMLISSYHHGSNDGDVILINTIPEFITTPFLHVAGEEERYGKYSKRVQRECGYPILSWHYYIGRPEIHVVPWEHSIELIEGSHNVT